MDAVEIQAKAMIAAALITSGAVELPTIPSGAEWAHDAAGVRLRHLTDYVYQLITKGKTDRNQSDGVQRVDRICWRMRRVAVTRPTAVARKATPSGWLQLARAAG
jgi:hypothetical protein